MKPALNLLSNNLVLTELYFFFCDNVECSYKFAFIIPVVFNNGLWNLLSVLNNRLNNPPDKQFTSHTQVKLTHIVKLIQSMATQNSPRIPGQKNDFKRIPIEFEMEQSRAEIVFVDLKASR